MLLSPALSLSINQAFAADINVNPGDSIQTAINTASNGDTIIINPGSYTESFTINKPLTITSDGNVATTTITGKITVTSSDVVVEELTVTNPGGNEGIVVGNSSNVVLSGNVVTNIGGVAYSQKVQAIYVYGNSSNVTISNNTISNIKSGAQSVNGLFIGDSTQISLNSGFVVAGNQFSDIATFAAKGAYGILVNRGSTGMAITGNSFDGITTTVTGSWSRGIGVEGNSLNANVSGNNISNVSSPAKTSGIIDSAGINFENNLSTSTVNVANNTFVNVYSNIQMHPSITAGTVLDVRGNGNIWSVVDQSNLDQIEDVIAHNCIDSLFAKGECTVGEGSPLLYGIVRYADFPSTPEIVFPNEADAFNLTPILNDWTDSVSAHGISKYVIEYEYDDGHSFPGGPYRESTVSQRNHIPALSEEGGVQFRVKSVDNYDNESGWSDWRHYHYDITDAQSVFTSPASGSKFNSPIGLNGTSQDNVGVDFVTISYKFSSDDDILSNWVVLADVSNPTKDSPFNWSYIWSPLSDGIFDIKVSATDKAGNVENTGYIYDIEYDSTPPAVPELVSPSNGAYIKPADAWLDWTDVTDPNGPVTYNYRSSWSGGSYGPVSTGTNSIINATASQSRTYNWEVQACDSLGNCSDWSGPWTVTIDGTIPTTPKWTNTEKLTQNGDLNSGGTRVEMKFTESYDEFGLNNYQYQYVRYDLDGNKVQGGTNVNMNTYGGITCSSGECTWKPDVQDNSQWIFRMRAIDKAGNVSSWSNWNDASDAQFQDLTFDYDDYLNDTGVFSRADYDSTTPGNASFLVRENVNPTSQITTSNFNTVDPNIVVDYTAGDEGTEVKNVKLYNSSDVLLSTSTTGQFVYTLTDGDGTYCFYTVAEDIAYDGLLDGGVGNLEETPTDKCQLEVVLDSTAPSVAEVEFIVDFNPYIRGGGFIVHSNVSDTLSGIDSDSCMFSFNGGATWSSGNYILGKCIGVAEASDAEILNVIVEVKDNFGNTAQSSPVTRTADLYNPESVVTINDLYYGPNTYTPTTVNGNATDSASEVESLKITIKRSGDNRYWSGSSFCFLCFLPNQLNISTVTLPTWVYSDLPGSSLTNGRTYTITPYAVDSVLRVAQGVSDTFIWDNQNPNDPTLFTATPTYVDNPTYTNDNTIHVDWPEVGQLGGASDALSGVAGYSYSFTNGPTDTPDSVMDLVYNETEVTSDPLADGTWYFHIRTVDNVGNWTSTEHVGPFVVDITDPTLTVNSPSNGSWVNHFTVTGTATDVTSGINNVTVEFRKYSDSSLITSCVSNYTNPNWNLDVNGVSTCVVPDGRYNIEVIATDNATNNQTDSINNVKVDTSGPNMGSVTFTVDFDPYVNGNGFAVSVPVSESYSQSLARRGLDTSFCKFSYDNGATWENGNYSFILGRCVDTKTASNGEVLGVLVKSRDLLGNESITSLITRTADRNDPSIIVDISNDYYGPGTFDMGTIKGTSSDDVSGVKGVNITIRRSSDNRYWDGSTWKILPTLLNVTADTPEWATWSYDGTSISFTDGVTYTVKAFALDNVLNSYNSSDSFTWDSYIETPVHVSPDDGLYIQSPLALFSWNEIIDINGPVEYTLILNGSDHASTYLTTFDGTGIPEGDYDWQVRACDILDNCAISDPWKIIIDNTSPINPEGFESIPDINTPSQGNTATVTWGDISVVVPTQAEEVSPSTIVLGASDNLSGVDGFSYLFSQNELDTPDTAKDLDSDATEASQSTLTDGDWYFHLRTVDRAGNWSDPISYGPLVFDNQIPVITLVGPATLNLTVGDTYTEQGATALDNEDGNITGSIVVNSSTVNVNVAGTYVVTYNVSDSAGNSADEVTRTVEVANAPLVPAPAVQGADDIEEEEEEGEVEGEDDQDGEVLGLQCEVTQTVTGYVYEDKNGNGKKDNHEKGFEGVEIEIVYTDEDGEKVVVTTVKTDEDGKWEYDLCPSEYSLSLKEGTLPDGYEVAGESDMNITVKAGSDLNDVNIVVETDSSSFNWWWIVIILLLLAILTGLYLYLRKRNSSQID